MVRMLFAKSHGTSLGLQDWFAQAGEGQTEEDRDFLAEAAQNLWQSISRGGLSYPQALQTLEKKVLTTALLSGRLTRREIAKKLRTTERTLYHMIRTHRLGSHPTT